VRRNLATGEGEPLHGYLNVLKPPSLTSFDVVARLRSITSQRRVGHAGTLDPAAIGVLPVALGRATPTLASPLWNRKLYWADVRFGIATDTDDGEGRPIAEGSAEAVTAGSILAALPRFLGDIQQRPPAFSAVQIEGRRAYASARRGELAELPERPARVDAISLVRWAAPFASLLVQCGSGTYIRSIARDLGSAIGCPAHMAHLVRLRVGPFAIREALDLRALAAIAEQGAWERALWPTDIVMSDLPSVIAPDAQEQDYVQGRERGAARDDTTSPESIATQGDAVDAATCRAYTHSGRFLGLIRHTEMMRWQPLRGLPRPEAARA
jgi:tRNA pseudouridine55 synthase